MAAGSEHRKKLKLLQKNSSPSKRGESQFIFGQKQNMQRMAEDNGLPRIDDTTQQITHLVYARDPSIIDPNTGNCDQIEAFTHVNELDIGNLIFMRQLQEKEQVSPRIRAALKQKL